MRASIRKNAATAYKAMRASVRALSRVPPSSRPIRYSTVPLPTQNAAKQVNYPLPGATTTADHYQLTKLAKSSAVPAKPRIDLNATPLMSAPLTPETHFTAIREFGEASSTHNSGGAMQLAPLDETHTLQMRVSNVPEVAKTELATLFPDRAASIKKKDANMTLVQLSQKTETDQRAWSERMEEEREQLTVHFIDTATTICNKLRSEGYWADFIDPSSGRPYLGPFTNDTLFETDERLRRMGGMYIEDMGCCKVISHPEWNTHVFVGTIFTNAPHDCDDLHMIERMVNVH